MVAAVLALAFPLIAGQFGNAWVRIADIALLYIMLALGLNVVVGFAGLLDLGYIAFFAIGAYLAALLASPQFVAIIESLQLEYPAAGEWLLHVAGPALAADGLHLPVWLIVPIAAVAAGAAGALLGAPTLKLRGDYLAIVTLGFGEIIRIFMNNLNGPVNITNGPQGINLIDPIRIGDLSLAGEPGSGGIVRLGELALPSVTAYYYLFLLLCVATIFMSTRLQHSRLGRAWIAIREDEVAAKAMGINVRNMKLLAFAMGSTFGGVAGAMFASFQGFISPESFTLTESIAILAMVVLGGIGHIPGVVLGAVLLAALPEVLRHTVEPLQVALFGQVVIEAEVLRQMLYGLALVLIMLARPAGLWPSPRKEDRLNVQPAGGAA
ncbi:MAG: ABC transporter ATP-binding protein [Burkholderiaceae bacterium]|nr:ABC transporter ATP-binding protein [Burkholderiaceae bacterium]